MKGKKVPKCPCILSVCETSEPWCAGCDVSCLILSFPRINHTENSKTLIRLQSTDQSSQSRWMCGCLSVAAGRTALILPAPLPFLFLICLCHSLKGQWTSKQQLHSDPKEELSLFMQHTLWLLSPCTCVYSKSLLCQRGYLEAGSVQAANQSKADIHILVEEELQH